MTTAEKADEIYEKGLKAFRSGNDDRSLALTNQSLEIGKILRDDIVVGQALVGSCRVALRNHDKDHL